MAQNLRIALAQINCTVGDFEGNLSKIGHYIRMAKDNGVDIVAFPELAITGYPPEDLLLKPSFIDDNISTLKKIIKLTSGITTVVGFVDRKSSRLYNSAAIIHNGSLKSVYHKMHLPNYEVFDEKRYFTPGNTPAIFRLGKTNFGVNICEDIWIPDGPTKLEAHNGAKLIINISASPYYQGKIKLRQSVIMRQAKDNKVFIAYLNLVGAQDELVFDGHSMIVGPDGKLIIESQAFKENLLMCDIGLSEQKNRVNKPVVIIADKLKTAVKPNLTLKHPQKFKPIEETYQALLLGLKDYVRKNGFKKVLIGLSGGIDSSLVAALAVDSLGRDNVIGVFMPSGYTSPESARDVKLLVNNLQVKLVNISIEQLYRLYLLMLEPQFIGLKKDTTEENLQARIRGNILMALSNKFSYLVLTTGNKSEMSTGYATLYGDMAGGFAVIKDVPKTLVYELAKYRNTQGAIIPQTIIDRPPTAELRPNQKDSDTLPQYEILDPILKSYIELDKDIEEISRLGFNPHVISKALWMVDKSEYKRRQSPPGIKITPKAFGKDRRMPITNKYLGSLPQANRFWREDK